MFIYSFVLLAVLAGSALSENCDIVIEYKNAALVDGENCENIAKDAMNIMGKPTWVEYTLMSTGTTQNALGRCRAATPTTGVDAGKLQCKCAAVPIKTSVFGKDRSAFRCVKDDAASTPVVQTIQFWSETTPKCKHMEVCSPYVHCKKATVATSLVDEKQAAAILAPLDFYLPWLAHTGTKRSDPHKSEDGKHIETDFTNVFIDQHTFTHYAQANTPVTITQPTADDAFEIKTLHLSGCETMQIDGIPQDTAAPKLVTFAK